MSAVTARVSNDLRNRIVAVLREDRDVRNIGSLADQLEAAIRSAEPVAWLRHGEETPVQNVPFGAMWISDKDDPRSFPVYDCPQQPAPSVAVKALEWNPYRAETPFGWYQIEDQRSVPESELKGRPPFLLFGSRLDYSRHPTLEAARAAAEADYEARIFSTVSAQVQDVAAIAQLNAIVDAWEALPGGRQVRNSDVEAWLRKHMAPAINAIRAFLNRPLPEGT